MKKFFCLLLFGIFLCFSTISLSGCKKSEIEKVSKNLTSYAISAELDDKQKQISASQKVVYKNTTDGALNYICFHLYPRAFRKDAIVKPYTTLTQAACFPNGVSFGDINIVQTKVNGEIKEYILTGEDEDILKIDFGFEVEQTKSVEIEIDFVLAIPNATHRFGWFDGNINLGNWYPVVCMFENGSFDMTPYYSTGDPFFSDIANYQVEFVFDSNYKLVSTGNINLEDSGEKSKAKISANAVRDFTICLSNKSKIISKIDNEINHVYMGYETDKEHQKYLDILVDATKFFSETFGGYPYGTISVVKTPFIYGGMEYPNVVFISDSVDDEEEFLKVIVHEIAHQWWYGVVGNNEISEAWLDESLAEYSTALFFEKYSSYGLTYDDMVSGALSSYLLYVDVVKTIRGDVNTKMNLKVNEYQNDYEYSYMVYVKGVIMFDSLKTMVGEKKVVAGLKKYYNDNKFKIATKNKFYSAFKSACHQDLENFFEGYLNGETIISSINWQGLCKLCYKKVLFFFMLC